MQAARWLRKQFASHRMNFDVPLLSVKGSVHSPSPLRSFLLLAFEGPFAMLVSGLKMLLSNVGVLLTLSRDRHCRYRRLPFDGLALFSSCSAASLWSSRAIGLS